MKSVQVVKGRWKRWSACRRYTAVGGTTVPDLLCSAKSALEWLCLSQDVTGCGGFARAYSLINGWELPYPETTGYIIPTFLSLNARFPNLNLETRARMAGCWLSDVQFESGALCRKQYYQGNTAPSVFNTGMGLHGWVALAESVKDESSLISARKAADWIILQQESDGSWIRNSFNSIPHTYYTMVDWALLALFRLTGVEKYREAAVRHLEWTLKQQQNNGWFDHCGFSLADPVTTHTLSYTTQGLAEAGRLLGENRYVEAAQAGTSPLLACFKERGILPGVFDSEWRSLSRWECLTGNAQTSIVWKSLGGYFGDRIYQKAASELDERMLRYQKIGSRCREINGGIPGSWPLDGAYDTFAFPNHAAKFHIDSVTFSEKPTLAEVSSL